MGQHQQHYDFSNHEDSRTTLMLRNVPNKYTQRMLLDLLNEKGFKGEYDFFYLPIDFTNRCNMGYAFINVTSHEAAERFRVAFDKAKLKAYNSPKVCDVKYARLQGY